MAFDIACGGVEDTQESNIFLYSSKRPGITFSTVMSKSQLPAVHCAVWQLQFLPVQVTQ